MVWVVPRSSARMAMTAPIRMEVLEARETFGFISFATFQFLSENKKRRRHAIART